MHTGLAWSCDFTAFHRGRAARLMHLVATYPTAAHEHASERLVEFFVAYTEVDAVLLVGSCARGKGYQGIDFGSDPRKPPHFTG